MRTRLLSGLAIAFVLAGLAPSVLAQQQVPQGIIIDGLTGCDFRTGVITAGCIPIFIANLVKFIFSLIGVFFLLGIIVAGYQITIASIQGGDRSKGYNRLIYSIVGFLVAACSFIIMDVILSVILG